MKMRVDTRSSRIFSSGDAPGKTASPAWYRSRRSVIFLFVFLTCAAIGLIYDYSRPAIYRSSATLLTSAMTAVDRQSGDPDIQHVAIQMQLLLGRELAAETLSRLKAADKSLESLTVPDIQNLLHVEPIPETNLVEVLAEDTDAKFLPVLINTWIDVYLDARAAEVKKLTGNTTRILESEVEDLGNKVDSARESLEIFRKTHDISSIEREENEELARLKGLNESLNKASEEEVKAKANLDAIKSAISRGKAVVPDDEKGSLLELELRMQDLREKLADLDKKYTRDYINLHPEFKFIPEQIKDLENTIHRKRQDGKNVVLTDAEVTYAAARQSVREIRAQLDEHKRLASAFTTKFAKHDALRADLESLEQLYRETQDRLMQVKSGQREKYPQVSIISRAYESRHPVSPDYRHDALLVVGGSLLLALFSVWIAEFLTHKKEEPPSPIAVFGLQTYASPKAELAGYSQPVANQLDHKEQGAANALASPSGRELSSHQLRALLNASNLKGKQLIALLLSGLSFDEAASLRPEQIDLSAGTISVNGRGPRTVFMSHSLKSLFQHSGNRPCWNPDDSGVRIDLSAALVCAAVDSGLPDPQQITAEAVRHSYIAYLVRQGLRLSDLEQVIGYLEPPAMLSYSAYSPPQQGRKIGEIELLHPALMAG
ncbi:MAG TPA: integrase [Nitrosospira sp.]|nr:integrase [Nitrosospira sp.]